MKVRETRTGMTLKMSRWNNVLFLARRFGFALVGLSFGQRNTLCICKRGVRLGIAFSRRTQDSFDNNCS